MDVAATGEDETMTTLVTTTLMTSPACQDCDDVNIVEQNNDFSQFKQSISTNILPGIFISLISLR